MKKKNPAIFAVLDHLSLLTPSSGFAVAYLNKGFYMDNLN